MADSLADLGFTPAVSAIPATASATTSAGIDPLAAVGFAPVAPETKPADSGVAKSTNPAVNVVSNLRDAAGFVATAQNALTSGLGNTAKALVETAPHAISNWFTGGNYDLGKEYVQHRVEAEAPINQFASEHPIASKVASGVGIGGQIAATVAAAPEIAALKAAPTLGSVVRSGIGGGVTFGAASGVGETPGTPADQALGGVTGGIIGGVTGGLLAPVAHGATDLALRAVGKGAPTLRQGAEDITSKIAGTNPSLENATAAGESVASSVQNRAAFHQNMGDSLYKSAALTGAEVSGPAVRGIPDAVEAALRSGAHPIDLDPTLHPAATKAMSAIRDLGALGDSSPTVALEDTGAGKPSVAQTRRIINSPSLKPATAADAFALAGVRRGFSDAFGKLADDPSAIIGDPNAIKLVQDGNAHWSAFKGLTSAKAGDKVGQAVATMADGSVTGQVAADLLYTSAGSNKAASTAARVADRLSSTFGSDSPEMNAVRQGAFLRMVGNDKNGAPYSPAAIKKNITTFLSGTGAPIAERLFTPAQRMAISRFGNSIPDVIPTGPMSPKAQTAWRILHQAGALAAAGLGMHYSGDSLVAQAIGGFSGLAAGEVLPHLVTRRLSQDSLNPLLNVPLFGDRAATKAAAVTGGRIGGAIGSTLGTTNPPSTSP